MENLVKSMASQFMKREIRSIFEIIRNNSCRKDVQSKAYKSNGTGRQKDDEENQAHNHEKEIGASLNTSRKHTIIITSPPNTRTL